MTSSIRTEMPYHRTVQVTESTMEETARSAPERRATGERAQHSTAFLILISVLVALTASIYSSLLPLWPLDSTGQPVQASLIACCSIITTLCSHLWLFLTLCR